MATTSLPQLSPVMTHAHNLNRQPSNSQPSNAPLVQQFPSKREKRHIMMAERYQEKENGFKDTKDARYRQQLLAIQLASSLVSEADAHGSKKLPDQPEEIDALVIETYNRSGMKGSLTEAFSRAGIMYSEFAREVNSAMEQRDVEMTIHRSTFEAKKNALRADYQYSRTLAQNEHAALSSTTRDRLINTLVSRRNRLNKEKDSIELGDSNVIPLHPSQYGVANPSSPGAVQFKRTTRLRRDVEDPTTQYEFNKRKRKAGEGEESPAPLRQRLENGITTPLWHAERAHLTQMQQFSPIYSIDKLFNEKELSLTYNAAAMAAHQHMVRHPYESSSDTDSSNKSSASSDAGKTWATGAENEEKNGIAVNAEPDSPLTTAPNMDRQPSHATRSTRVILPTPNQLIGVNGIEVLADINYPGNMEALAAQIPRLPHPNASVMTKPYLKGEGANQPAGLLPEDAAIEIEIMKRAKSFNEINGVGMNLLVDNGGRELLEIVTKNWAEGRWIDRNLPRDNSATESEEVTMDKDSEEKAEFLTFREQEEAGEGYINRMGSEVATAPAMSRQGTNESVPPLMLGRGRRGKAAAS